MTPLAVRGSLLGSEMRTPLVIGLAGFVIFGFAPQPHAQKLTDIIGSIIYPRDARAYEERAHRERRPEEERYWHDYGEGLRKQNYSREAQEHEEEARRNRRPDEEHYWHNYGEGLREQGYR